MKTFKVISVDSGCIMVADLDYVTAQGWSYPNKDQLLKVIQDHDGCVHDLPVGEYLTTLVIKNTWNGIISQCGLLKVTSGKIVVIDPCYVCDAPREQGTSKELNPENQEAWGEWCERTNYGDVSPEGIVLMANMGGDGEYTVNAQFQKVA
jgi:hypothetical protein